MKNSDGTNLRFHTDSDKKNIKFKRFLLVFFLAVLIIGGTGTALFLKYYDYDFNNVVADYSKEETTSRQEQLTVPDIEGVTNMLLCCTSDAGNKLRYACILSVDMDTHKLLLTPLMRDVAIECGECVGTLEQQLDFGGDKQLVAAVESATGCVMDKFIRCKDSGFRAVMNSLGTVTVNVTKNLDVRDGELIAIFNKGEQEMSGDTLLKYLRCYDDNPRRQCEILALVFRQKLIRENLDRADKLYETIINRVESDISVFDFQSMKLSLEELVSDEKSVRVIVNY